jgi:hypothetical protein
MRDTKKRLIMRNEEVSFSSSLECCYLSHFILFIRTSHFNLYICMMCTVYHVCVMCMPARAMCNV